MVDIAAALADFAVRYGYLGALATTALGSVVPFLPFPNLFVVILLSAVLDPAELGLLAGIGGSLGKITSYLLGRGGYRLSKRETRRNLDTIRGFLGKRGMLGIFVLAITPLRDEVYAVPMGVLKFPFGRFLIANTMGKIILYTAVAYLGRFYLATAQLFLGEGEVVAIALTIISTMGITLLLTNADWELVVNLYGKKGLRGLISNLPSLLFRSEREEE